MKNLLFVLLLSFSFAKAQDTPTPSTPNAPTSTDKPSKVDRGDNLGFRIGLQFSPEFVWMKAQDKLTNSSPLKFGFSYGLMFDYNIARRYSFSTGLYVSQMSSQITYNTDSMKFQSFKDITFRQNTKVNYSKLEYIEVPISLKLKTNEIGYLTYFGQFGFQGGIKIKVKGDISDMSGNNNKVDENLGPDISIGNIALLLGAGVEYSLTSNTSAYVAFNFVNGFLDVTNSPKDYKTKVTLNQFALRLGIFF